MHRFTQKSIKDSDIDLARVEKRLSEIAEEIKINNKNNLTDINVICEEIFGQILNKLYDIKLVSMSAEVSGNYIAVDLVDYEKRIAYQVTSQNIRNKIDRTLEKFNSSGMYKDIDEVHFLILSSDEHRYNGKHHVGRYEDEEEICMQIQNMRINLNAHTAYHIYKLFEELKEEYFATKSEIDSILGTNGLSRVGNRYLLMTIDIMEWEEILFFARNHDWFQEDGELEWNIFNNNCSRNSLILSPNVNGNIRGDILATISVIPNKTWNNKLDLYWEPGFKANERCMDRFDNVVKWKADYTAEWIKNRLLEKSHIYYEKCNGKKSFWQKIWN